ncbi:alternate-type signal peptide domain-containing protein [Rhodococcus marinonascens]|uniref:alternate-type signal peptide domain-containing protein n=1 Tax=Rhodococcus marinonascens TaxID=38311 RepID=UPI0009349980|nr:alternate-type signal peptide domain-containing protein [Rhodococcus marinonascens]
MNKQTKGAIAAGAAALLLAGGAGTMAAWNDSASVGGGSVQSGTLSLDQVNETGWTDSKGAPIADISQFLAVPGDVLTYSASFEIGATGNNLSATLTADESTIDGDAALADALGLATTATINDVELADGTITTENNGNVVDVEVKVTFNDVEGNAAQGESVDLTNFSVELKQNA